MITAKDYLGDINGGSLTPGESQIIANMLLKHLSKEEWDRQLVDENILQRNTPSSNKRIAATIVTRLKDLPEAYWQDLADADKNQAIQLCFLATLINSPILADFLKSVVIEAFRLYQEKLSNQHWEEFFNDRCTTIAGLDDFSEGVKARFRINSFRILSEVGYLKSTRAKLLQGVFILPEVIQWAETLGRADLIKVMECK